MPSRRRQSWATERGVLVGQRRTRAGPTAPARRTAGRRRPASRSRAGTRSAERRASPARRSAGWPRRARPAPRGSWRRSGRRGQDRDERLGQLGALGQDRVAVVEDEEQPLALAGGRRSAPWSDRPAGSGSPRAADDRRQHEVRVGQRCRTRRSRRRPRTGRAAPARAGGRSRVLPTPPGPVSVRSDECSRIRVACSISRSRPMKLVTSSLRLFRGASVVRGGGKSRARPGPVTWNSRCGSVQRAQPVGAEVDRAPIGAAQLVGDQVAGRLGDEDLAAVAGRADPRGAVDVEPDVALRGAPRLAGVEPHPVAHRDPVGPLAGRRSRAARPRPPGPRRVRSRRRSTGRRPAEPRSTAPWRANASRISRW